MWTDWHCDPEENKMIILPHKKKDQLSHQTFITWVSRTLELVEKDTIINGWNPLVASHIKSGPIAETESDIDLKEVDGILQ